jgi:hypothetical protein
MASLVGEVLLYLVRSLVLDLLKGAAVRVCAWLDPKITERWAQLIIGGLLGVAAYFAVPIILGLLS